ncbi:uncharacterized protein Z519_08838 [Cladophialophora bantiana CBS 173.52]|uniref:Peptidase S59 domain-containing protein n=1 Tax=Cladophialophora bantiana (strain ATCC 10958 / CBS 173.52 / CDC B-1940 / NIH 8579) TaxID=1442370 RepID=A0A0D2HHC5_CLAB1|nr:uncharacterized protein Z519_08838 [Cladophialophora bantiana CBS 173.52]KIW90195.1 hypothetical protein Z519_08838 [Cladophialophora bantiana CBS 173.52]
MSFASGGAFSFGSNNNNQSTGFGGFGSNTNAGTGFGTNTSTTGFGSSTATANPFGSSTFGSNTGGFGGNTNTSGSLFGNKPASNPFGSTTTNTGGGIFGSSNTNTGFGSGGGFGSTNNAFGSNTGGTGFSFGSASKPTFGSSNNSTPLFGQGGAGTTGGFGSTTSSPFGAAGSGTALGNQPVAPSEGTASTPYAPTLEKEAAGLSSNYQSINFMPPYQKYSFEELRLADYNAGRRYGNTTGQAGGFGSNTFGGFGSSNTGFGSNTSSTPNPFGSTAASSSGFGANTATSGFGGGGLFGNKPAGGGLFGTQSTAAPSTGLFGTSNTATNAFGSGTTGFGSGGGLFGQNQNQSKPSLFGNPSSTTSSFSFGNTNTANTNTGTGLFGNNTNTSNTSAFGGNQQQSSGLFGNNTNQQQKPSLFGNTSFAASANQNQQSGGLFGNTNNTPTSGGLFGNTTNTNTSTSGGLFGTNNSTSGTSLFGNNAGNQQKPGGIFGGSTFGNTNTNTGGGLFGNTNNQQQSGGLFGNTSTNTGSGFSFGNTASKPAAGSLFNTTNNQQGGFGGSTSGFGSIFGTSQNNPQNQQQPDFKVSSLNDPNPYGQTSIWTGLPVPTPDNSKPLFTPLSATQKLKESQSKPPPSLRLNQSRYMTPPRRSGFGFSYSTYGTPNSAASTPGGSGLSSSMYGSRSFNGGSFGRSFGKSASASNLRSQFTVDGEGVLSPNAFASTNTRWSSGNMRRLTIDRSIRNDLFSRPSLPAFPTNTLDRSVNGNNEVSVVANGESLSASEPTNKLKKRVSFDKDTAGGSNGVLNGESGALVRTENDRDEVDGIPAGSAVNDTPTSEVEPVRGNELAVVPEDRESDDVISRKTTVQAKPDPQPGDYWMKPTRAELSKMPREKLSRFVGFEVGRKGCGKVVFNGPVDLTSLPLDDLYEKIVEIRLRSVTVYPDASSKPPVGKGLNVPSTISIENSWPRSRGQPSSATSGPIFDKHVNRLKKMHGTEFVNYEVTTGVWTFRVPHYTRYGLDYDDDEMGQSLLSAPPDSLNSSLSTENSGMDVDSEAHDDYDVDGDDDTFAFKQKTLPGGYGRQSIVDYHNDVPAAQATEESAMGSEMEEDYSDDENDNEVSMVGSYPPPTASPNKPILKHSTMGTPGKALINIDGDWAEQLQRTISPRKQNRDALRQVQSKILLDRTYEPMRPSLDFKPVNKTEFRTSIDIMNSLFSRHEERMAQLKGKKGKSEAGPDFEFPYAKRAKTFEDQIRDESTQMGENDKLWRASFKPHFTSINQLVYKSVDAPNESDWTTEVLAHSGTTGRNVVISSLRTVTIENSMLTDAQVLLAENVPWIKHEAVAFSQIRDHLVQHRIAAGELDIYELLHVLFDDYEDEFTLGLNRQQQQEFQSRIRRDRLSKYLSELVWRRYGDRIKDSSKLNGATAAIMQLTANSIHAACDSLMQEKDFNLALLVAQIGQADSAFQEDIADQISAWRGQRVISEMSEEIRALYEILSGNTNIVQGWQNVPVEDRASTFAISEKFGLDWIQAFALCFWYGKHKNGEIHEVVADFQEKLNSKLESATPFCGENEYEDPLWVVLKIFAGNSGTNKGKAGSRAAASVASQIEKPVLPQALSALSQPWNSETTFRLHHAIVATIPGISIDQNRSDDLALSLAFEYSARRDTVGAVYALLHLSDPAQRVDQIRHLLDRHGATLPSPPRPDGAAATQGSSLWAAFTTSLCIPAPWIHQSKALHARSCNNHLAELNYLLAASDFRSAHDCFLRRVAPRLVIDEDWETLREVLGWFGDEAEQTVDTAMASGGDENLGTQWRTGGQVYADFVELMMDLSTPTRRGSADGSAETKRRAKKGLLLRLQGSLTELNAQSQVMSSATGSGFSDLNKDREKLEERVALCEMGRMVARGLELESEGVSEKKHILDLPLNADARLIHARTLGVEYYRGVMAMAR